MSNVSGAEDQALEKPKVDGRNLRAEDTRKRIVDGAKRLVMPSEQESVINPWPKVADIARAADRCVRSVHQHFPFVSDLVDAVFEDEDFVDRCREALWKRLGLPDLVETGDEERDRKAKATIEIAKQRLLRIAYPDLVKSDEPR